MVVQLTALLTLYNCNVPGMKVCVLYMPMMLLPCGGSPPQTPRGKQRGESVKRSEDERGHRKGCFAALEPGSKGALRAPLRQPLPADV